MIAEDITNEINPALRDEVLRRGAGSIASNSAP